MKQRYLSLVLSIVVLFLSAGVLFVRGQNTYVAPNDPFPIGVKDVPIDTGNLPQGKGNSIAPLQIDLTSSSSRDSGILMRTNQLISNGANSLGLDSAGSIVLFSSAGRTEINTQGLVLPSLSASPSPKAGMIYYDTTNKKVKLNTTGVSDGWTDIGTGSGTGTTGDTFWKANGSGGILYDKGDVTIDNTGMINTTGFWLTGIAKIEGKQYSIISTAQAASDGNQLACDTDRYYQDCPSPYLGGFKSGSVQIVNGVTGYDEFAECPDYNSLQGNLNISTGKCNYYTEDGYLQHTGEPDYKRANYIYETRTTGSTGNTTKLTAGFYEGGIGLLDVSAQKVKTKSLSALNGEGCYGFGVKGMVVSAVVNTGGSGGDQTSFIILDSLSLASPNPAKASDRGGNRYWGFSLANDQGDVTLGRGDIQVCIVPGGTRRFIDSIKVNYIPLSF